MQRRGLIKKDLKIVVVKIGTVLLTRGTLYIDRRQIAKIVNQIVNLKKKGFEVVLVTSGAIASGMSKLKITKRPKEIPFLQSCAAIGQSQLMRVYDEYFSKSGFLTAQILLTRDDFSQRNRYLNAKNTLRTLLQCNVVPIINENDTVGIEEIKFGDNDRLAALVANLVEADILILLSNVDGFYIKDDFFVSSLQAGKLKRQERISVIEKITSFHTKMAFGPGKLGSGGMITKLEAAKIAAESGIYTVIANGNKKEVLSNILNGLDIGTVFLPAQSKLAARKKWIAFGQKTKGILYVDEGAKEALIKKGRSLLAAGIKKIKGEFLYGNSITIADEKGREFARGLINYSSQELEKIKGKNSSEIEKILGYKYFDEVIHRNNLTLLTMED